MLKESWPVFCKNKGCLCSGTLQGEYSKTPFSAQWLPKFFQDRRCAKSLRPPGWHARRPKPLRLPVRIFEAAPHQRAFRLFGECHAPFHAVDADEISQLHLPVAHTVRQRKDNVLFNRAFQMPRTVLCVSTFFEQEGLDRGCATEDELAVPVA